ncbi:MAG: response regulator transcription factor [Chloroflexi bacterium]|nr:response regulator transcription factor [Chloroflexota bacterium]
MKRFCILLVDDEPRIVHFLSAKLRVSDYEVLTASNGVEALQQFRTQEPDMVVLDVMMPKKDGLETLKELRSFSSVPVIMLSAKGTNADKVAGLDLGADDYLAKPFSPDELVARIEALRRRLASSDKRKAPEQFSLGDLTIDFKKHTVIVRGEEIRLTRIEWLLLNELTRNAGRLMLHGELLTRVWGPEYRDDVQILRTWVSRLRYKIEKDSSQPVLIRTVAKTGYIIDRID